MKEMKKKKGYIYKCDSCGSESKKSDECCGGIMKKKMKK